MGGEDAGAEESLTRAIAGLLPEARWCAEKGRAVADPRLVECVPLAGGVALAILELRPGPAAAAATPARDVTPARYLTVVRPPAAADVAIEADFARWLVAAVTSGATTRGRAGRLVGRPVGGAATDIGAGTTGPVVVAPLGADTSNTSFRVRQGGQDLAVKLLRRCRGGIQPEVEVGEFLATAAASFPTPRLRGWLDYVDDASGGSTAVATLHDFAGGRVGAWERLLELATAGGLCGPQGDHLLAVVAAIGGATARMHDALASAPDDPAFAPERATRTDLHDIAVGLADHARQVLGGRAAPLVARFEPLPRECAEVPLVRVHGDYHLGQLLLAADPGREADTPLIIDFEGEPSRSLADRRRKQPAAKDVAGMLRSFDYLLRSAAAAGGPVWRAEDLRRLEGAFLDAYHGLRRAVRGGWWPPDPVCGERLLEAYTIDKAIYELDYERHNRPDWVPVPEAAVELLLRTS
jgi:predicted trehalose synthase